MLFYSSDSSDDKVEWSARNSFFYFSEETEKWQNLAKNGIFWHNN